MNIKKAYIYLLSIVSLAIMFTFCYYLSYKHALNKFNKMSIERSQELADIREDDIETIIPQEEESTLNVGMVDIQAIKPTTKYILETYSLNDKTLSTEELSPPAHFVGLSREQILNYIDNYMEDLTLQEYNKGLVSCELIRFSEEEFILRKTYDDNLIPFRFYVAVKDGYVIVYNSDLKSIHTYTYIEAQKLPEDDRIALSKGIYIESPEELYSLLESYSS